MNETAASPLTVLRTRLPYVDRRALSEAWISALGLQCDGSGVPHRPVARERATASADASVPNRRAQAVAGYPAAAVARRYAATVRASGAGATIATLDVRAARRAPREAARAERSYPPRRSSLTVGLDGSRVQLLLRREGSVLHVVALCRADTAATVRDALVRAGAFLRVRGDALRASVRTVDDTVAPVRG